MDVDENDETAAACRVNAMPTFRECIYIYICVCVCVCRVNAMPTFREYMYIYVCVCVRVYRHSCKIFEEFYNRGKLVYVWTSVFSVRSESRRSQYTYIHTYILKHMHNLCRFLQTWETCTFFIRRKSRRSQEWSSQLCMITECVCMCMYVCMY